MTHEVTVSPKFQIVIPKELRERMRLKPGQKLLLFDLNGTVRLGTPRPIAELRGMCKGMKWSIDDRDHSERF
jgi:AbrB family looped-hinge helix DNA binding protein